MNSNNNVHTMFNVSNSNDNDSQWAAVLFLLYSIILSVSQFQAVYVEFSISSFMTILISIRPHIFAFLLFF